MLRRTDMPSAALGRIRISKRASKSGTGILPVGPVGVPPAGFSAGRMPTGPTAGTAVPLFLDDLLNDRRGHGFVGRVCPGETRQELHTLTTCLTLEIGAADSQHPQSFAVIHPG